MYSLILWLIKYIQNDNKYKDGDYKKYKKMRKKSKWCCDVNQKCILLRDNDYFKKMLKETAKKRREKQIRLGLIKENEE